MEARMMKFGLFLTVLIGAVIFLGAPLTPFPRLHLLLYYLVILSFIYSFELLERFGYKGFGSLGLALTGIFIMLNPEEAYSICRIFRGPWMATDSPDAMRFGGWIFGGMAILVALSIYFDKIGKA